MGKGSEKSDKPIKPGPRGGWKNKPKRIGMVVARVKGKTKAYGRRSGKPAASNPNAPFPWTPQREQCAIHLAEDQMSDNRITQKLGIHPSTLHTWKCHPEFAARVDKLTNAMRDRVRRRGLGMKEYRLKCLIDRHEKLLQIAEERAADKEIKKAPGGTTGYVTRELKKIGSGDDSELIEEFPVDTGFLNEIRAHEKQFAQEAGEWTEKKEISGAVGVIRADLDGLASLLKDPATAELATALAERLSTPKPPENAPTGPAIAGETAPEADPQAGKPNAI